jgi:LuxR family maltose regulon positive regulatory protein
MRQGRLNRKLILISAPAGFGKTTALSEWARQAQLPVSWLSLNEHDNDLARFWTYVVAALQQTCSDMGESTLAMLRSPEPIPFELFVVPLLNELAQLQTHRVLVLDDYHLIAANSIHESITFFLEHLPTQVHLAIANWRFCKILQPRCQIRRSQTNSLSVLQQSNGTLVISMASWR